MKKHYLIDTVTEKEKDITDILEKKGSIDIGRSMENDFITAENENKTKVDRGRNQEGVSRKHARIYLSNNKIYLEDLNSMNGTKIHYGSIYEKVKEESKEITDGYEIYLGNYGPIVFS